MLCQFVAIQFVAHSIRRTFNSSPVHGSEREREKRTETEIKIEKEFRISQLRGSTRNVNQYIPDLKSLLEDNEYLEHSTFVLGNSLVLTIHLKPSETTRLWFHETKKSPLLIKWTSGKLVSNLGAIVGKNNPLKKQGKSYKIFRSDITRSPLNY